MKRNKARTARIKSNGSFHHNPTLALPRTGQRAAEIQAFGTIVKLPNGLSETVCRASDGTNDLLVSGVIRTNELQVWFLAEHLVDTPQVIAQ